MVTTAWLPLPIHLLKRLVICFRSQARTVNYNVTFLMELEINYTTDTTITNSNCSYYIFFNLEQSTTVR